FALRAVLDIAGGVDDLAGHARRFGGRRGLGGSGKGGRRDDGESGGEEGQTENTFHGTSESLVESFEDRRVCRGALDRAILPRRASRGGVSSEGPQGFTRAATAPTRERRRRASSRLPLSLRTARGP